MRFQCVATVQHNPSLRGKKHGNDPDLGPFMCNEIAHGSGKKWGLEKRKTRKKPKSDAGLGYGGVV
jgi:hypothetical protein